MAVKKKKRKSKPKASTTRAREVALDRDWEAEDDVRTLTRAQEIQNSKPRLARAAKMAKKNAVEATKIAKQLKRKRK